MTKLSMSEEEMLKRKYTRPYEKKIEELGKENNKLLDVINNQDVKIADLVKQIAELKARLNAINLLTPELEKISKSEKRQLTKAKELLERCYENYIYLEPLRSEIEQFLKEIEK